MMRYRGTPVPARATVGDGVWRFAFLRPQPRPAPGQALVVYDGEYVRGGGTIVHDRTAVTVVG